MDQFYRRSVFFESVLYEIAAAHDPFSGRHLSGNAGPARTGDQIAGATHFATRAETGPLRR